MSLRFTSSAQIVATVDGGAAPGRGGPRRLVPGVRHRRLRHRGDQPDRGRQRGPGATTGHRPGDGLPAGRALRAHHRAERPVRLRVRGAGLPREHAGPPPADRLGADADRPAGVPAVPGRRGLRLRRGLGPVLRAARRRDGPVHLGPAAGWACCRSTRCAPAGWWSTPACTTSAGPADRASSSCGTTRRPRAPTSSNEIDRYISLARPGAGLHDRPPRDPRLRGVAEQRLGARFDIRAFHGTVLGNGAVPLGVLGQLVTRWADGAVGAEGERA